MSYPCLLGSKLGDMINLYSKKHPTMKYKPLVDYNMAFVLIPMVLIGSTIGVIVNTVVINFLLILFLVLIILFAFSKTVLKARDYIRKEMEAKKLKAS